ncbi:hypothetical protein F132_59 [Flavobacterium sp. phage 1/32]|nr:hypothetical protein F132_59 [Flavobacterium sp. phage 1/32]
MVKAQFEHDVGVLRGLIKSSGCETDPYKIIILIERFILEYGTKATKETVSFLLKRGVSKEQKLEVILDVLQTQKTLEELLIFKYLHK